MPEPRGSSTPARMADLDRTFKVAAITLFVTAALAGIFSLARAHLSIDAPGYRGRHSVVLTSFGTSGARNSGDESNLPTEHAIQIALAEDDFDEIGEADQRGLIFAALVAGVIGSMGGRRAWWVAAFGGVAGLQLLYRLRQGLGFDIEEIRGHLSGRPGIQSVVEAPIPAGFWLMGGLLLTATLVAAARLYAFRSGGPRAETS